MFQSPPTHHAHTFKFLLARLSSSGLARALVFSVSWWCKLWLPKILELLPLSSHTDEAHSFWPSLWGSLCSSAPTNNTVLSQTLYTEAVSVSQFLLPGFLEQWFFFGSWIKYGKRQSSVCSLLSALVGQHVCHLLQCRRESLHTNPVTCSYFSEAPEQSSTDKRS